VTREDVRWGAGLMAGMALMVLVLPLVLLAWIVQGLER
jgi:hypothetical protein